MRARSWSARLCVSRDARLGLGDIVEAAERISVYTAGLDKSALLADGKTYDAVLFNLLKIGEAAKQIPDDFRARYPDVEWRKIAGLRDVIAHGYFALDDDIVWDVVSSKVAPLGARVRAILMLIAPVG